MMYGSSSSNCKPPNNGSGLNAFLALVGIILSFQSSLQAVTGDYSDRYFTTALVVIAVIGAFVAGMNMRAAIDNMTEVTAKLMERAAARAVEARMADVERMVDERVSLVEDDLDGRMAEAARRHDEQSGALHGSDLATDEDVAERFRMMGEAPREGAGGPKGGR